MTRVGARSRSAAGHGGADVRPERDTIGSVRRGEVPAEAHVRRALDGLRDWGRLNLLVDEPIEAALGHARTIDRDREAGRPLGPLAGLPVVVKDNIAVAGRPLTGASPALQGHRPERDAGSVARLVAAGAVVVGQTNMHELALGVTSDNGAHGPVRNPFDLERSAGGSSGGTAAAVGAGAVLAGLATDTGGSGRIPAAWCGTFGFRPSTGRYPDDGLLGLSRTMDTVSVMTRSLDGLALLDGFLGGLAGPWHWSHAPAPSGLRLGVPTSCWERAAPEVRGGCEAALDAFSAAGVVLVPVDLDPVHALDRAVNRSLVSYEIVEFWTAFAADHLASDLAGLIGRLASPDVAERLDDMGSQHRRSATEYARLRSAAAAVAAAYHQQLRALRLDAVAFPTVPVTAPLVGATVVQLPDGEHDIFEALTMTETVASLAGAPALTVPAGHDGNGMPFGLELDGPRGGDRRLLAVGRTLVGLLPEQPPAPDRAWR